MTLWLAIAAAALLCGLWLAWPFLVKARVESSEAEHAISIYRDQREELRRDARNQLISEAERDAAEQEIERRALRAARRLDAGVLVSRRRPAAAALAALAVAGGSLGLYAWLGTPDAEDQPLAARRTAILERQAQAGDLESQVLLQIERTRENPENFEDWWLLARSYVALGDYASAVAPYRQAVALSNDDPAVLTSYAEVLTLANGNKVPTEARLIFAQVRQQTNDPRARYYLALARAQAQDFQGALDSWLALLRDSTPDAPWTPLVRRDIVNMARFLELDLATVLPDATEAELAKAGSPVAATPDPAAQIAALESRLAEAPKDWQGWIALARMKAGQGDGDAALAALDAGREHYAGAPFVMAKFDETAEALGLAAAPAPRGPSDAEVAAAAEMSEDERQAMIRGMVEGLAARLERQPDDLQGWLMLIRSYAVLQEPDAAEAAVRQAKAAFRGTPAGLKEITQLADGLGVPQE